MPKYTYKFCEGSVSEVEVTDEQYVLLSAMDKQERMNDHYQGRRNTPLDYYVRKEEKADKKRDDDFKKANK